MKILPAIDLLDGRCVRLAQGDFQRVTAYDDDPVARARAFAADGATHLHVVDLNGARDPAARQLDVISKIVDVAKLEVQVGGGIRSVEDAQALFDLGVWRVVVGSLAITDPTATARLLETFGVQRVVLALDARADSDGVFRCSAAGWTETGPPLLDLVATYARFGALNVLCTDIARDGMLTGPALALYRTLQAASPTLRLIASGGVSEVNDLRELAKLGADAAIVGKALYSGRVTLQEALAC